MFYKVGAGLQVAPNATRLLKKWDLPDSFWATAAEPTFLAVHRYSDGKVLAMKKDFNTKMRDNDRAPFSIFTASIYSWRCISVPSPSVSNSS
ncbi:hypothetical protein GMDG_05093 [Pseudogymnoascus destructans 20631-21]|uniref:Uncharacterized protein n=1 Tax=Pseudogymnoascus destructans (strain ATCC MYA-4855 / 20631-21) TaxID=658429 RepID=L8FLX7_PSED2|nr:hypothetical protein GMDG_05093 [Pseudogymnoascus destructans 20631-21]